VGGLESDVDLTKSACFNTGLGADHGSMGEGGILADLFLLLSMSSRTTLIRRSDGSSTPALFTVRLLS
jgi:hypothetical protein